MRSVAPVQTKRSAVPVVAKLVALALGAALPLACSGAIDGSETAMTGDPQNTGRSAGQPGMAGGPGGEPTGAQPGAVTPTPGQGTQPGQPGPGQPMSPGGACTTTPGGTTMMRRLSRAEYNNTVRDLLGTTTRPGDQFQTDDSFAGYETNGPSPVVRLHTERFMEAAEKQAAQADLSKLLPCAVAAGDDACARTFVTTFGKRAYRRPLETAEVDRIFAVYKDKRTRGADFAAGVRLVINGILQSPNFLYRPEIALPTKASALSASGAYEMAARLSYFLWASMPDDKLFAAAEGGALGDKVRLEAEVRRLLADARAVDGFQSFFRQFLGLPQLQTVVKDEKLFPDWKPALKTSMAEEERRFIEHLWREGGASFATALTAGYSFVDATLGKHYGVAMAPAMGFARADMPAGQRSGLITQGGFLATQALADQASPIHRGLFVRERLLCAHVPAPPSGVDITPPKVDSTRPARERFEAHRKEPSCASCHQLFDPLGFGFQRYDAIGKWQQMDGKFPIDDKGEIFGVAPDIDGTFTGALELGAKIVASPTAQACMARQWIRFGLGRNETDGEACLMASLGKRLADAKFDLRELLVSVATSDSFRVRGENR